MAEGGVIAADEVDEMIIGCVDVVLLSWYQLGVFMTESAFILANSATDETLGWSVEITGTIVELEMLAEEEICGDRVDDVDKDDDEYSVVEVSSA